MSTTMRGAVLSEQGITLREREVVSLAPGWVKVRVVLAGVCGTDLEIVDGYKQGFDGVLGHEFVGVVDEVGSACSRLTKGQRVVGEINLPCKAENCSVCTGSDPFAARNHCPARHCLGIWKHDGAFAEFLTLPEENLYVVPDNVPDEMAVFAEPLAAAFRIVEQGLVREPSLNVAVLGDGRLGLLIATALVSSDKESSQRRITVVGRHPPKMEMLPQSVSKVASSPAQLETLENSFDVVVEVTGTHSGFDDATRLVRPLGTLVRKSTCSSRASGDTKAQLERLNEAQSRVVVKELCILGSRCGPFPQALQALEHNPAVRSLLPRLISSRVPLSRIHDALHLAKQPGQLKVLVDCSR